jgi:D-arabinose 1-dehydrogenase-like Zn-dependent alcohol dehydrogenase
MRAMVLEAVRSPLRPRDLPDPLPGRGEVRVLVEACAVCRADLHVVDGDLPRPELPLVPKAGVRTETVPSPLDAANQALDDLLEDRLEGAAVLVPNASAE